MSTPTKYNLSILEWQQFEVLSFKCLQFDVSPSVQFVEGGNDKGRDIFYTGITHFFSQSNDTRKYIFQIKHKSHENSFNSLKSDLHKELLKVYITNKFDYDFYCLVTNLTLTGNQYDELKTVFESFLHQYKVQLNVDFSIYSYRHLESCIDKNDSLKWTFPSIIHQTDFKLLLDDFISRRQANISRGWLSIFKRNKDKFILTNIYNEAIEKLQSNNVLLLSGPPKSGKTFNAEMIIFNKVCEDKCVPYKIEKVEDFEKFYDVDKKQIFLFDDAFGKHNIDLFRADVLDRKLEFIFECIDQNHKCIFTSREY
ncbi:MAG: hypothetical protein Q8M94_22285, partial [Ignavibacteria bacterium]|nr:hypothetical protein [Ignavibacteria bacterium]